MKSEKRKRGTQHREASAADTKMINPAVGPLDPDVLKTGTASKAAAAEFMPASEPLDEEQDSAQKKSKPVPEKTETDAKPERKSGAAGEYYKPNTPLEEKPQSGSATRRKMKENASNPGQPDAGGKAAKRTR